MLRSFRILAGVHDEDGKEYAANVQGQNIVRTHRDLVKSFPNKFEEVVETPAVSPVGVPTPTPASKTPEKAANAPSPAPVAAVIPLGEDASGDFDAALSADLKVWKKDKNFWVTEPATPDKALNKEPLKLKDVEKFITGLKR